MLDVEELSASIREHGILQPIRVRAIGGGKYQIVAGHRRFAASRMAGMSSIPAVIATDGVEASAIQSVVENLQRENLTPLELVRGIRELESGYGFSIDEIARAISKSVGQVRTYVRAAMLPDDVLGRLESGEGRTQEVQGLTVRHVAPLMAGADAAEASARIRELLKRTQDRGIRINAHQADAIGRHVSQGRMTIGEAVEKVLQNPEQYRYGRAPSTPEELQGDTWAVYRRIHRELQAMAVKLRPEIAGAFEPRQRADLIEKVDQLTAWLDLYRAALAGREPKSVERPLIATGASSVSPDSVQVEES